MDYLQLHDDEDDSVQDSLNEKSASETGQLKAGDRCLTQAYNMHQSTSATVISNQSLSLTYGSAKLVGFLFKDYTCLQPLNLGDTQTNLTNSTVLARVSDKDSNVYNVQKEKQFLE